MNLRRIQKTCGGTFFVCLPKVWAQKNSLDKGSVVSLSETADGNLIVNPKYNIERKLKEIATDRKAAIMAYSMAVAPRSSAKNFASIS